MAKIVLLPIEPSLKLQEKIISFEEESWIRIGRSHSHECALPSNGLLPQNHRQISYHHAYVSYVDEQFYIEDVSRNGTYINGQRIIPNELHVIISGDVVQFGQETFSQKRNFETPSFFIKLFKPSDADFEHFTSLRQSYDSPLQLYRTPPDFEYSLEDLHSCIRERFEVMQMLDDAGNINFNQTSKVLDFLSFLRQKSLSNFMRLVLGLSDSFEEEYNLQKMDHVSHYIIRLSCCQNYVIKKWFMDQEEKMFHLRWYFLTSNEKCKVITTNFSQMKKISNEEKQTIMTASRDYLDTNLDYYKVHFSQISGLLNQRTIFIKDGYCFIPLNEMIFAVVMDVIKATRNSLELMHKNLHKIWYDERITSIIKYIKEKVDFERFLFDKRRGSVRLADIDKLAKESFPLCMNILHYNLKRHNHLRHGGRYQYGLFLKGIGLSLLDSLKFWRYYFTKKMPLDNFQKNYEYHIKHSYGAVGKKADYPPQSCKRILGAVPGYGEYHGCPFKVLKEEEMDSLLKRIHISHEGKMDILECMKKGTPQLACKRYFELTHDVPLNEAPYHPNKYFEDSQKVRNEVISKASSGECSCHQNYDW